MATYTTNYNLIKPADADGYDIAHQNGNMDIIDGALNGLNSNINRFSDFAIVSVDGTNLVDACDNFLTAMLNNNAHIGIGHIATGGYSYICTMYVNNSSWATALIGGYNGVAYHAYKENGTWITKLITTT